MTQVSHVNASAQRLLEAALALVYASNRLAREQDINAVSDLLSNVISEAGTIQRQNTRIVQLCQQMQESIRASQAVTVCHERGKPITDTPSALSPRG